MKGTEESTANLREMDMMGTVVWANDWVHIPKENMKHVAFRHKKHLKLSQVPKKKKVQKIENGKKKKKRLDTFFNKPTNVLGVWKQLICFPLQGHFPLHEQH